MTRKRWVKIIILIFVGVSVLAGMHFISSRMNAPHQGTVNAVNNLKPLVPIDTSPKQVSSKYVSFSYPSQLEPAANETLAAPFVEQFKYQYHDIETWILAVDVMRNPGGSVNSLSDYKVRKLKPAVYKQSSETVNGQPIIIMTDTSTNGFNKVAFLAHGTMAATVSLTGDDPEGAKPLSKDFNIVLSSWQWK